MKKDVVAKITAAMTLLLNVNSSNAQNLTLEEVKNMQYLLENKFLIQENGSFKLNESLNESGLIEYLDSVKTTNCTGGGSCW